MQIETLHVRAFRNLLDQQLTLGPRFNVLWGDNAQGKTNLLEAVYVVACLKSFRARRSAEMVRFGEQQAAVRATVRAAELSRELEVVLRPGGRRALLDGKGVRSSADYLAAGIKVVVFTADDVQIPRGSPSLRRQLVDRAIATLWPPYVELHRQHQKVLLSRNRLLKQGGGQREQEALLAVFDEQLAQCGARVVAARQRYLKAIGERFQAVFADMVRSGVCATLRYEASEGVLAAGQEPAALTRALRLELELARGVDRARQQTTVGPQQHDVALELDGRSTRSFGSQGQLRALMLAFKVTQILDMDSRSGDPPVLLLDDVSSELDANRNEYLFEFIDKLACQALLTTTRPQLVVLKEKREDFQVVKGVITRQF